MLRIILDFSGSVYYVASVYFVGMSPILICLYAKLSDAIKMILQSFKF